MAASSYDFNAPLTEASGSKQRFSLPKIRAAAFGGGCGLFVVAVGLLVIGIGWNGMAGGGGEVNGVPNLNAQLPWLVSGGILGLALLFKGLSRGVRHRAATRRELKRSRLERETLRQQKEQLATELDSERARAAAAPASPAPAPVDRAAGDAPAAAPVTRTVPARDRNEVTH